MMSLNLDLDEFFTAPHTVLRNILNSLCHGLKLMYNLSEGEGTCYWAFLM